jgi:hypothetical protein
MATQTWKTVSVRLSEDVENALKFLCEKRGQKKHALLKELLLTELDPILKPGHLQESEGIPLIGEHIFKYNAERDSFTWQVDLGVHGIHALAENVPFSFIDNLHGMMGKAIEQRNKVVNKIPKRKTIVPKSILKYKVR